MGRAVLLYNSSTILTMPLLRPYAAFSSFTRRAAPRSIRQSAAARPISSTCARFAQGYGDGEGDPKGETPQDQGPSNGTVRRIKKQGGKGNWIQPNRRRDWKERRIRNSSKAMTELLQLQRIRLTRSSGRVKEGLLITSRNTL